MTAPTTPWPTNLDDLFAEAAPARYSAEGHTPLVPQATVCDDVVVLTPVD